jgi:hypothetical protein
MNIKKLPVPQYTEISRNLDANFKSMGKTHRRLFKPKQVYSTSLSLDLRSQRLER